ncbi:histidine phosphatase family protein [Kitasatospora sp. NPDC101155]|uniref:histidine phosphatase family protein n=1 Tax=Kitasatospora sp. NPDC101155 TaxID=3364097 RepID=UPI003814EB9E
MAPSTRCRLTAGVLGITAEPAGALADLHVGSWRGHSLDEIAVTQPAEVSSWLADPTATPQRGESVAALYARVGGWLEWPDRLRTCRPRCACQVPDMGLYGLRLLQDFRS